MTRHAHELDSPGLTETIRTAVSHLLRAAGYAEETHDTRWEYAVEIARLLDFGLDNNDLRWLVRKGFVEHGREVTPPGDNSRIFRPTGNLTFAKRTCFVLTEAGIHFAIASCRKNGSPPVDSGPLFPTHHAPATLTPNWDMEMRELTVSGLIVKRYKWQAINQELVLNTFQEDGWPAVIDDPLPPKLEQDTKRRLHDTIKALNRNQQHPILRFHGNGTGEGIRWELVDAAKGNAPPASCKPACLAPLCNRSL